jgi:hypothetical protein
VAAVAVPGACGRMAVHCGCACVTALRGRSAAARRLGTSESLWVVVCRLCHVRAMRAL